MPTTYVRKSQRASYSQQDLNNAIEKVRRKELTNGEASRIYGIPTSTLNDRVRQKTGHLSTSLGRPTIIPAEKEKSLADCLRTIEKWGWGLSRKEILDLVQQFIQRNRLSTPFRNGRPGKDWFIGFRKRHHLSIKKPQSVEYLRKQCTDPFVTSEYFSLLGDTLTKLKLDDPHRIWNLDETSVCLDPTKTKIVGAVGAPCVRTTTGNGRENITVLAAVNAAGKKINPLLIYKGKNMYEQWIAKPKPEHDFEVAYAATKRGWIDTETFYNYMSKIMIPSLGHERPVLIIYDGHTTHLDERVIKLAVENDITILKLPAHTSHLLQPLDLAVFKSFKNAWDMKLVDWQRQNVGKKIQKQQFADLFADAWHQMTPKVIQSGFKKGGIYPFNPTVIPKETYDPNSYKRWTEHVSKQSVIPLTKLCLGVINKYMTETDSPTVSFEQLLLEKVTQQPRTQSNKTMHKLKRVATGAEVITHTLIEQQKTREIGEDKHIHKSKKTNKPDLDKKKKIARKAQPTPNAHSKKHDSNTSDTEIAGPSGLQLNVVLHDLKHAQALQTVQNPVGSDSPTKLYADLGDAH
ncbi:tigger transposable element-derived protein 1-like [Cydia strobilella]|uniref:tigger transposable element-derived protein 1-like n=1 Tax=Cydia strobilella TaxID=1100964 RepID=UPI003006F7FA